jgi:heme-degrading monooxygenase HmoA
MVAVLIEIDVRGVERDVTLTELREQTVPAIKNLPGFASGTWLMGSGFEKVVSLTLWDTQDHASALVDRFGVGGSSRLMSGSVVRFEVHEVAATA